MYRAQTPAQFALRTAQHVHHRQCAHHAPSGSSSTPPTTGATTARLLAV